MEDFYITFTCNEGAFVISVFTDHIFQAKDVKSAMKIAENLETRISKFFTPYYDKHKKDFFIQITENEYFKRAYISKFETYDFSLHNDTEHTKEKFINLIGEHYKSYLKTNDVLTFETIAYGIEKQEPLEQMEQIEDEYGPTLPYVFEEDEHGNPLEKGANEMEKCALCKWENSETDETLDEFFKNKIKDFYLCDYHENELNAFCEEVKGWQSPKTK
ncbi:hypothetical protein OKW24_005690 [Peribacillus simplex]|uniref:hypothetical protein n=1 Tax=Peribacillus simplex TaxID=1478 RepID=UPI0024E1AB2A|nr:hypothetical protein [Peribacillus simplex]MDF9763794.1 hypothetical protein [Peribacillus simplex]